MTEWDIRSWCWQPGLPVRLYFKVAMSAPYHKYSVPVLILDVMILDVARVPHTKPHKKQHLRSYQDGCRFVTVRTHGDYFTAILGDQTAGTMTRYLSQSHFLGTGLSHWFVYAYNFGGTVN